MSLKEAAAKLAAQKAGKFGSLPTEAQAFLDDLGPAEEKQPPKSNVATVEPRKQEAATEQGGTTAPPEGRSNGRRRGAAKKYDLRQENVTFRDIQFSTRIDDELNERIRAYCVKRKRGLRKRTQRYGLGEFLEDAIDALEREMNTVTIDGKKS